MAERPTLAQFAANVRAWIEAQGFSVSPSSRLGRMHSMFHDRHGNPIPLPIFASNDANFEVALEALRDVQMLGFAFDQLAQADFPPTVRQRFKRLLKDTTLPQDNLGDSPGRDVQCELYVAAVCMKAGMLPTFEEPDNRCSVDGKTFAVAVKRVKSIGSFEDRIRGGVNQINKVGLLGVVIADVSVMLNPTNARVETPLTDDEYRDASRSDLMGFIDDHRNKLDEWFKGSKAIGLIVINHHVRLHPTRGWLLQTLHLNVNQSQFNQRRRREFDNFFDTFAKGLPAI